MTQLPIEFLTGKSIMIDGPDELETINKFFEDLPASYFSTNWCSTFILGYYTLNRESFLKGKKIGDVVKKVDNFHLMSRYFGKIIETKHVITPEGINYGIVFHLQSRSNSNSFFLPNDNFLPYGSRLVLFFTKTR